MTAAAHLKKFHNVYWKQGLTFKDLPYVVTPFMTEHLKNGRWPWNDGIMMRLPEHFKQSFIERHTKPQQPVHWRPAPDYYRCPVTGEKRRQDNLNVPIKALHPKESKQGLWGGEGIVFGFYKKGMARRQPRFWRPKLEMRDFYSEILDRWMSIVVTPRTLDLIDDSYGFDFYILQTHEVDLVSDLGMKLKREMLTALVDQSLLPNDEAKREKIFNKYKQFMVPKEEIEWMGLSIYEAWKKQCDLEEQNRIQQTKPLKDVYMTELLKEIADFEEGYSTGGSVTSGASSWLSKMNPFGKKGT
ncbi:large ribosomal subunit protein bL28m-like [Tubulanus polymorphus]|uniref:large ribosomal subunit protein bL28m-like n=1 Tax=Tubulanus polymorphus TaxID=672921 RepID=UPI003DA47D25